VLYGWRAAFFTTGATGLLWVAAWIAFYKTSETAKNSIRQPGGVWAILANRDLYGLMATRLFATPVWWFYVFWLPDYLGEGRGLSMKEIGMFGWVPYLTVDIGKLIGGRLSDRLIARGRPSTSARKTVMAAGAICMAAGLFVVEASSVTTALAWVSVATFGFGMWSANILALHADLFESATMASAVGWTTAASSIGGAAFTWLTGRMVDVQGYGLVFAMVGSTALAAFAVLWFAVGVPKRVEAVA
jgi:ACS family hexuronate transporter-like MFS transporter